MTCLIDAKKNILGENGQLKEQSIKSVLAAAKSIFELGKLSNADCKAST